MTSERTSDPSPEFSFLKVSRKPAKKNRFASLASTEPCSVDTTEYSGENWRLREFMMFAVQTTGDVIQVRTICAYTEETAIRLTKQAIHEMTGDQRIRLNILKNAPVLAEEKLDA